MARSGSKSTETEGKSRRSSSNVLSKSNYMKKNNKSKRSDTEMECPECSFRTRVVNTWRIHLKRTHNATPYLAGVVLRCECGYEVLSDKHSFWCEISNFTVIRTRDGPIRRVDDEKTTPQCILCEIYPKTIYGYSRHVNTHHKSTLNANGIYLRCACGYELYSDRGNPNHTKKCRGREFSLHNLYELNECNESEGEENGRDVGSEMFQEERGTEKKKRMKRKRKLRENEKANGQGMKKKMKRRMKKKDFSSVQKSIEEEKMEIVYRSITEILKGEDEIESGSIYRRIRKLASPNTPLPLWKTLLRKFERSADRLKEGEAILEEIYPFTQDMNVDAREKSYRKLTRRLARLIREAQPQHFQ